MAENIHVPETVLARIWEEQRFFPDCLYTTTGQPVQVIRPGRLNHDTGPDFIDALIRIGDHTLEGAVELHLHLHDWEAHGHQHDPHYNRTVLHVVLWPPERPTLSATIVSKANGEPVPTVFVHHVLNASLAELVQHFQDADQHKRDKRQQCQAQRAHLPGEQVLAAIAQLGQNRLYTRARRFHEDFLGQQPDPHDSDFEQALYEALCEGLGYAANKAPFRELARRLPLHVIMTHLPTVQGERPSDQLGWIQALLFGASGLLQPLKHSTESEPEPEANLENDAYLDQLTALWGMLAPTLDLKPMSPEAWQFFRLRPANFPTRRIAALSYLVLDYTVQPVFAHYLELFNFCRRHPGQETKQIRLFERTLQLAIAGYWQTRYRFGPPAKTARDRQFIGPSRIRDIIVSAVFPAYLCYARVRGDAGLETDILRLYQRFPSPDWDHGTQTLAADVFAQHNIPAKNLKTAAVYQGLLHLSKTACSVPACTDCPLITGEKPGVQKPDFCTPGSHGA